ncbi:unnamed protein product [Trichogramma brassicae]|uniref:Uncharacterized protein n=1 Tax=Trichogramma brassicae TaxID=86971 RepID=A0A6H5IKH1_9HYME|nr:unnamed protein product [Trichogramma brassicae]
MDSYKVLFNKSINQQKLKTLKKSRGNIRWNIEDERVEFLRQLDPLINGWDGPLPDIADIFEWRGEVEYLLSDCIKIMGDNYYQAKRFIDFVIAIGYKNVPEINNDGKPLLRRTTPVHLATRRWFVNRDQIIRELFKIYQANYIDEYGQTHFHVACSYGFDDIVEKFLDLGQDHNCVTEKTGDSPLHLALSYFNAGLVKLLLRRGANPNLANAQGLTPLHILCARDDVDNDFLETFFKMCDDEHQTLKVNAKDKLGNTPLCTTLKSKNEKVAEFLLRRGSDPNLADESGSTSLHIICKSNRFFHNEEFLSKKFFKIIDENQQTVHIDAKDNLGRTPLQWAVANVMPHAVDVLLKRGADLSNFTFPTTNYFAKRYDCSYDVSFYGRFIYTSKTLAIVERLEDAGFELDQDVALRIAKFFAKHRMFQKKNLEKSCLDHEKLTSRAKKITIKKNLSLHELIQLEPKQAAKLVTPKDYAKLATSRKFVNIPGQHRQECAEHLCEKVARGFFRRLALYPFWEKVIWYRLPLECCEMILENLTNRDLCNIYLAANMSDGDSSSNKSQQARLLLQRRSRVREREKRRRQQSRDAEDLEGCYPRLRRVRQYSFVARAREPANWPPRVRLLYGLYLFCRPVIIVVKKNEVKKGNIIISDLGVLAWRRYRKSVLIRTAGSHGYSKCISRQSKHVTRYTQELSFEVISLVETSFFSIDEESSRRSGLAYTTTVVIQASHCRTAIRHVCQVYKARTAGRGVSNGSGAGNKTCRRHIQARQKFCRWDRCAHRSLARVCTRVKQIIFPQRVRATVCGYVIDHWRIEIKHFNNLKKEKFTS